MSFEEVSNLIGKYLVWFPKKRVSEIVLVKSVCDGKATYDSWYFREKGAVCVTGVKVPVEDSRFIHFSGVYNSLEELLAKYPTDKLVLAMAMNGYDKKPWY